MEWREVYYGPIGYRIRWKVGGFNSEGQPYNLELERYIASVDEWAPIPNYNVKDGFALGLMAGRTIGQGEQQELAL